MNYFDFRFDAIRSKLCTIPNYGSRVCFIGRVRFDVDVLIQYCRLFELWISMSVYYFVPLVKHTLI